MQHEIDSLEKNHTWDLFPQSNGKNVMKCQWVYWTKFMFYSVVECHKAHFIMKVFFQQEGIDYIETFSPVARMNFSRLILSLIAWFGWSIHQMDVKSSFLHGNLVEDIYMKPPPSFVTNPTLVCHLKKSLYGLKHAP